jgi:selenocysteine lyase/cysteine desulfurase
MQTQTGQLDREDLEQKLSSRTRLLAIGAASNALGTINNVAAAARQAHAVGALVFVDAVHYAPHALVDVRAMDCDFLACSAYKFHGPHVGILWGRHELLQGLDVPKVQPAPEVPPERWETGTQNHEGIVGAAAAVEFLASLGEGRTSRERLQASYHALHALGESSLRRLWEGLGAITGMTLFGPPPSEPRTPTLSFTLREMPAAEVCRHLAAKGLFASHGDFYATTAVARLGQDKDGLVRIGCACYTTEDEIARLIEAVRDIAAHGQ